MSYLDFQLLLYVPSEQYEPCVPLRAGICDTTVLWLGRGTGGPGALSTISPAQSWCC